MPTTVPATNLLDITTRVQWDTLASPLMSTGHDIYQRVFGQQTYAAGPNKCGFSHSLNIPGIRRQLLFEGESVPKI